MCVKAETKKYALEWSIKRHSNETRSAAQVVEDAREFEKYLLEKDENTP